ncbi:MAG: LLM class flavin-dependent oxidoreductase [Thermoleophilia bacterium]
MKFGLLFGFQIPPGSPIRAHEPYQDMLRCLPRAEELGYVSAYSVEHHVQPDCMTPSPLIALAGAAAVTERMRIGTNILLVPLYHPVKLAEDVAVLDNLSNGRFTFGVAPGYVSEEFALMGVPRDERNKRFEEALDLMQRAWTEETFSFEGHFYRVPECSLTPRPVQEPHPPIWYGVSGPLALKRAARRGATLVASPRHSLAELRAHYAAYDEEAARVGFEPTERPIVREVFIGRTMEEAERLAAPGLEHLFTELYGKKSAQGERELRDDQGTLITDEAAVSFETFKGRYVIGTPDFAISEIERYRDELGATEIVCWMHLPGIPGDDVMTSVELFAREVMPAFAD